MNVRLLLCLCLYAATVRGQSFTSGSTGADGTLEVITPGTVVFDPRVFDPPLNPKGDNVYHFKYIHIGKGVTLRLSSRILNNPIFWLVEGPVQIDGTIDLNGDDASRLPSVPGAGGYPGGPLGKPGYGPDSSFKQNAFLVPLVGGSGGDGRDIQGGGAGGGALLIASSTSNHRGRSDQCQRRLF